MINLKEHYAFYLTIVSFIILINTFTNSTIIKKFPKNKKRSVLIHSTIFYIIISLHFFNIYLNFNIHNFVFVFIYFIGIVAIIIGTFLGNYALLDGLTVYVNYIQVIYIIGLRFIFNIYNIYYNNDIYKDKISTLIMLNSQPLTRLLAYSIKKSLNNVKDEKEKTRISISVAQCAIVIGTAPLVFDNYEEITSIVVLISFLILCLTSKYVIKIRNKTILFFTK